MKKKIAFLLFSSTHLMDLSGPAQVFYEADQLGKSSFETLYASISEEVELAQGIRMSSLLHFKDLKLSKGDLICIPGINFQGFTEGKLDHEIAAVQAWVWEQKKAGVWIGSICSGALILGKMGLLDGVKCSTHWKCLSYFKKQFPHALLQENRLYCFHKGVFTSAGMTSGIDMALALVEQWCSPLLAAKVAQEMVINVRRAETKEQKNIFLDFKNHFNPDVYRAQEILANRMEVKFTMNDLARELNMSGRHLARLFRSHTGQTIHAYRNGLRLELGEQLLMNTERSVKEVAAACGFENARQFVRLWKKLKGLPPGQFRKQFHSSDA